MLMRPALVVIEQYCTARRHNNVMAYSDAKLTDARK